MLCLLCGCTKEEAEKEQVCVASETGYHRFFSTQTRKGAIRYK